MKRIAALALISAACQHPHGRPVDRPMLDEKNQILASERSGTGTEEEGAPPRALHERATYVLDPGASDSAPVTQAVAVMSPTKGNAISGSISFIQTDEGVAVRAVLKGVPKGPHALHVHMLGDCASPDAESAGGPFAFRGSSNDGHANAILGGIGEVTPTSDGTATLEIVVPDATLQGDHTIIGRSVIVHERGNDLSAPPDGNAGARLACGVIGVRDTGGAL